ncbi:MAG TPA: transaldolase family protein [Nitrospirales bacterium]|nr:transaldolase family protein [Nitrospirales bacterium]
MTTREPSLTVYDVLIALGQFQGLSANPKLISSPLLAALKDAGTAHIYADTASREELMTVLTVDQETILKEIDGNTVNQPLLAKVIKQYLKQDNPAKWAQHLREKEPELSQGDLLPLFYSIVCGKIGTDMVRAFASGRSWEVSLQLHMGLVHNLENAKQIGRSLRRMVPSAFVKVPFAPHAPMCFLIARDLEKEGIPVNFTSTFSARQVVAAALLSNVTRTNIFMGRLDQGLKAELLGAHVSLEAQRILLRLRGNSGIKTQLIVASLRDWGSLLHTAGCDVFTVPCKVLQEFLEQNEVKDSSIQSRLGTSYEDRLGIPDNIVAKLGADRIARLYTVEPEFVDFLLEYRVTTEYQDLDDGDHLVRRFEQAGFGDLFYAPDHHEWTALRRGKVPDLEDPITMRPSLDTLYSLLADADFEKYQEDMDREMTRYL